MEISQGIRQLLSDGTVTTFEHPISDNPPDDLQLVYEWSMNLSDWFNSDGLGGPLSGERVTSNASVNGGTASVTLTASEIMSKLFVRPVVTEVP